MIDSSKEIKRLLRGQFIVKDGITVAIEDMRLKSLVGWQGYLSGAENVNALGVSKEVNEYVCDDTIEDPLHLFMGILIRFGQLTALASKPDAVGFLATRGLGNAILFVLEEGEWGHMRISTYTARSATSQFLLNRVAKMVEDNIPDGVEKVELEDEGKKKRKKL